MLRNRYIPMRVYNTLTGMPVGPVRGSQMLALLIALLLVATAVVSFATIHSSVRTGIQAVRAIGRELAALDAPRPASLRPRQVRSTVRRQAFRPVPTAQRVAA